MKWSGVLAWIASFSSVYLALLFVAHYKATWMRQSWIDEDGVHLRYGLAGNADLPMHLIKKIQLTSRTPRELKKFTKLGHTFESHNVIIQLKGEVEIERMYGKKEYARSIGLMIDDQQLLKEQWEKRT